MRGIGERIELLEGAGQLPAVLVNPGVEIKTKDIFRRFDTQTENQPLKSEEFKQPAGSLRDRIAYSSNDLQRFATFHQNVSNCLNILEKYAPLTRMSGSGATCFGIFESATEAEIIAKNIKSEFPDWWVQPVMLGDLA